MENDIIFQVFLSLEMCEFVQGAQEKALLLRP